MTLNRRSKRHVEFVEVLKSIYPAIKVTEEYKVGNNLFIDVYLPAYSIGVEIDGIK